MEHTREKVERHYGHGQILDSIFEALGRMGKDLSRLTPADLAPVDRFHIRGHEATVELARRASLRPGTPVLDVGCGLGGSARYLAHEHGCKVTGIDLTQEYVDAARVLADTVRLSDDVSFQQASALELPFEDGSFEVVWTEHVQMNVEDKRAFYSEISRVLAPDGRLLFHDIFRGDGEALQYPVPWAEDPLISFLAKPATIRGLLEELGFVIQDWDDKSQQSHDWFVAALAKTQETGPPPLGLHLLMGPEGGLKFQNLVRNLQQKSVVVVQALAVKS